MVLVVQKRSYDLKNQCHHLVCGKYIDRLREMLQPVKCLSKEGRIDFIIDSERLTLLSLSYLT